jgi:hypothetical protein
MGLVAASAAIVAPGRLTARSRAVRAIRVIAKRLQAGISS